MHELHASSPVMADADKELCAETQWREQRIAAALRVKGSDLSKEEGTGRRTAGEADPWGLGAEGRWAQWKERQR